MEITIPNLRTETRIVQDSLRSLCLSPVKIMSKAPIRVTRTARNGLMETITSINHPSLDL